MQAGYLELQHSNEEEERRAGKQEANPQAASWQGPQRRALRRTHLLLLRCPHQPRRFLSALQLESSFASNTLPFDLYFIMAVFENEQGETERELIFKVANIDGKRI